LLGSDVDSVVFPNSGDSSPTPASSSVAIVHLWPKVSTPSRSSRHFLSVLLFNLQYRGRPIDFPSPSLFLSLSVVFRSISMIDGSSLYFVCPCGQSCCSSRLPCGCLWPSSLCCAPCWLPVPHVKKKMPTLHLGPSEIL
jgi:hypothetical protein